MLSSPILSNILLIIVLLINIITMILVIASMKRNKLTKGLVKEYQVSSVQTAAGLGVGSDQGRGYDDSGVVFCRSCGTQYDSANSACPRCKTSR
ncbi:hypothetical protein [Bacillus marasmi]|uniref:hypothetical protein n=1 Tax=Bacillus marasmi TaxID=1926279 RepID=UPI0011C7EA42|nr:hypothetical protein [Bacillus marasmi]